jgi:protein-disulfide isomerase
MAKKINRKTSRKATSKTINKTVASSSKNTSPKVAKVDVVAEAQEELRKIEADYQTPTPTPHSDGFAWGTFFSAIILSAAIFLVGIWFKEQYSIKNIEQKLPEIIKPLAGGMEVAEIGKPKNVSGIYQFTLKFADYDTEFTSSITKDGKLFFVEAIDVAELLQEATTADETTAAYAAVSCESVSKTDEPVLVAYVSSDCSHCKNAESAIASAIEQVPALASKIKLRYAGTINSSGKIVSFLGSEDAGTENLRQACIQAEQPDAFWSYIGCMAAGDTSESCIKTAQVNTTQANACMDNESRGLAIVQADIEAANDHSISGTPSFFLNDDQSVSDIDFGGRVADAYKQIICCGSNTQADFCATTLE